MKLLMRMVHFRILTKATILLCVHILELNISFTSRVLSKLLFLKKRRKLAQDASLVHTLT